MGVCFRVSPDNAPPVYGGPSGTLSLAEGPLLPPPPCSVWLRAYPPLDFCLACNFFFDLSLGMKNIKSKCLILCSSIGFLSLAPLVQAEEFNLDFPPNNECDTRVLLKDLFLYANQYELAKSALTDVNHQVYSELNQCYQLGAATSKTYQSGYNIVEYCSTQTDVVDLYKKHIFGKELVNDFNHTGFCGTATDPVREKSRVELLSKVNSVLENIAVVQTKLKEKLKQVKPDIR